MQEDSGWLEANTEIVYLFEGTDYSGSLSRARFKSFAWTTWYSMDLVKVPARQR